MNSEDSYNLIEIKGIFSNILERVSKNLLKKLDWKEVIFGLAKETQIKDIKIRISKEGELIIIGKSFKNIMKGLNYFSKQMEQLGYKCKTDDINSKFYLTGEINLQDYGIENKKNHSWKCDQGEIILLKNKIILYSSEYIQYKILYNKIINSIKRKNKNLPIFIDNEYKEIEKLEWNDYEKFMFVLFGSYLFLTLLPIFS